MLNVLGGDDVAAVVTLASDRRSATLTPVQPLLPYSRYYYTLGSYTDVAGNVGNGDRDLFLYRRHARRNRADRGRAVAARAARPDCRSTPASRR